ncbi:AraC-like DNA-binding protein [Paracandidimonas soli]|uniref:AraC-like DNA-binding protein n=2 Tax=Paracandidimonas soli TaxID=1917182 RepID=A0A4R3UXZ2_9BURK|nr:AraC-like DNA-binding protein [Paracandidimonas soli]
MSIYIKIDNYLFILDKIDHMGFFSSEDGGHALDLSMAETSRLPVTGVTMRYPQGHAVPMHQHCRGHLIYADRGLLRVETETGQWLVPPTSAVWLLPGVAHRLFVPVALRAHGLFVREDLCATLPESDRVVQVSGLAREIIVSLTGLDGRTENLRRAHLLGELLIEELRAPPPLPFHLPWPRDAQMQAVCQALIHDPGHDATAEDWADKLAMGGKTFHRRFLKGTGMSFGRWRQQLRLMSSLTLLMQGMPIIQVALASGYDSHSAYTTAFGKQFGHSPSAFMKHRPAAQT